MGVVFDYDVLDIEFCTSLSSAEDGGYSCVSDPFGGCTGYANT